MSPSSGDDARMTPKVRATACLGGVSLERGVPPADVAEYIRDPENVVWLDVQDPGPEEIALLFEEFGFHPLALEDVARAQQRAKVDEYKGYMFVVAYGVAEGAEPNDLRTVEVDLFIGRNYLVTVHHGRLPALEDAAARWTRAGKMLREGIGFLVYTVMDALIDGYFPLIDGIEEMMSEMEVELFTNFRAGDIQRLLRLKRALIALRRILFPLREVFHVFLRHDHPFFSADSRIYFQDVYDHILRILDALDIQRDVVAGTTDAYLTLGSNRLNVTMKRLTVVTVCVAILGAVFGAWGMNFQWIPLTQSWWGFWLVISGAAALVAIVLWVGRTRDWV
jgi:magnesium transporter